MSPWTLIRRSLHHYRRTHLAVAAGVAVATAVITGALLVGDSVRGSLRHLALDRLGGYDTALTAGRPFRVALGEETLAEGHPRGFHVAEPVFTARGSIEIRSRNNTRRAAGLTVLGIENTFWAQSDTPGVKLAAGEIALTAGVAKEVGASTGDTVLLRVPAPGASPAESLLGEKLDAVAARRLKIAAVLPPEGLAAFSLAPSQQTPPNVFVPLAVLQDLLDAKGKTNTLLFATDGQTTLTDALHPTPEDFGLTVEEKAIPGRGRAAIISSDRLVLPPAVVEAAQQAFPERGLQPVVTYLANTIRVGDKSIPYSTVTGVESTAALGPLLGDDGAPILLADDEIVLNDWAANELGASPNDTVTLTYYQPETTHGQLTEAPPLTLRLRAVVPLSDAAGNPTPASSTTFTPELPGVTDEDSIADWDLPFPLVERIRPQDETYWTQHRTTPKAFVSPALARRLWATRWGEVSLLRLPMAEDETAQAVGRQVTQHINPRDLGMALLPVKSQALRAASGTTPFEGLFIGFSFFLMASAIMLIVLLFRLGIDGRAREFGLLAACGITPGASLRIASTEAAIVALAGAVLGAAGGVAYAWVMVYGLTTWWVKATGAPFLALHTPVASLAIGLAIGLVVGVAASAWSLRNLLALSCRQLLAGITTDTRPRKPAGRLSRIAPWVLLLTACALAAAAMKLEGEPQAGAFFGSGTLVLAALLWRIRAAILRPTGRPFRKMNLAHLAATSARRNPTRTMLSVGLTAVACFLIVAMSAFRLAPTESGTGGFQILATTDQPILFDLATEEGRRELALSADLSDRLARATVCALRVHDGQDATCLNLYQTTEPTVLGVPRSFGEVSRFGWGSVKDGSGSPWSLLQTDLGTDDAGRPVVPVVLDKNTAAYSLHLGGIGSRLTIHDNAQRPVTLEVVGLLSGSVLQGRLLIDDDQFKKLFPDTAGSRLLLIRADDDARLTEELETELGDFGLDAHDAADTLAGYLAVQNTYLSTFQSLGLLGLLLGTVGLAVAQLRGVVERRGELALLRAVGFRAPRLGRLVLGENLVLLAAGLAVGCTAALVAVLPHAALSDASVPWQTLALLVAAVAASGAAAGWLATRAAVRPPLLPTLRGE